MWKYWKNVKFVGWDGAEIFLPQISDKGLTYYNCDTALIIVIRRYSITYDKRDINWLWYTLGCGANILLSSLDDLVNMRTIFQSKNIYMLLFVFVNLLWRCPHGLIQETILKKQYFPYTSNRLIIFQIYTHYLFCMLSFARSWTK